MLQVTMLLASAPGQPDGSVDDRFTLTLDLTWQGEIDAASFGAASWIATRQIAEAPVWRGELIRLDDGWGLQGEDREDSPIWVLSGRNFRPGRYVTIRTHEGAELVYRIVSVIDLNKDGQSAALDPLGAEPLEPEV